MSYFHILLLMKFLNFRAMEYQLTLKTTPTFLKVVFFISADNLSIIIHSLATFNTCFSRGRICCYCLVHIRSSENRLTFLSFVTSVTVVAQRHLQVADGKYLCGVTGRCPSDKLPHFGVTESFPPDLMRGIPKGAIPQVLKLVFQKLSHVQLLTLQQLNDLLQLFHFWQNNVTHRPVVPKPSALQ